MFTHYNIISIFKLNLKIDVVGLILDGVYPTGWNTDTLHGASRNALFDVINGLPLGIGLASVNVIHSNDTEKIHASASYEKIKEIIAYKNLKSVKISWEFHIETGESTSMTKVYINGVAVGVEKDTDLDTYVSVDDNITDIKYGDLIQIYCRNSAVANTYVKNMRIQYDEFVNNDP